MQSDRYNGQVWLNGDLIAATDKAIDIFNYSLHYACAAWEGIRAYNGVVFKIEEHVSRLLQSSKMLDMNITFTKQTISNAIYQLLERNSLKNCYIRPIAFYTSNNLRLDAIDKSSNLAITAWEVKKRETSNFNVTISKWRRHHPLASLAQCKFSGNYPISMLAKGAAIKEGFNDALFLDHEDYIAECTTSNIFFVKSGKLYTPKADRFLNGITRQTVIALAKNQGMEVIECRISLNELSSFSEAFLTGTSIGLQQINSITDGKSLYQFREDKYNSLLLDSYKSLILTQ